MNTLLSCVTDTVAKLTNGRFMTVDFIKADGTERTINGRVGVKYNGTKSPIRLDGAGKKYLLVYSVRDKGFRRINIETVKRISAEGSVLYSKA